MYMYRVVQTFFVSTRTHPASPAITVHGRSGWIHSYCVACCEWYGCYIGEKWLSRPAGAFHSSLVKKTEGVLPRVM